MTPSLPAETVVLTREQIEHILYAAYCMDRDQAETFWSHAKQLQAN
jgi:hypothetical protein